MATKEDFWAVAEQQRGLPEQAMVRATMFLGGGTLPAVIEYAGDLIHRMAEQNTFEAAGYPYVYEKVDKALKHLLSPRGFTRTYEEELLSNARYKKIPFEKYRTQVGLMLKRYVEEHRKLKPLNTAQRWANNAAIAIGELKVGEAVRWFKLLKMKLDQGEDAWIAFAHEGLERENPSEFEKERAEHPTLPASAIRQIVADHKATKKNPMESVRRLKGFIDPQGRYIPVLDHERAAEGLLRSDRVLCPQSDIPKGEEAIMYLLERGWVRVTPDACFDWIGGPFPSPTQFRKMEDLLAGFYRLIQRDFEVTVEGYGFRAGHYDFYYRDFLDSDSALMDYIQGAWTNPPPKWEGAIPKHLRVPFFDKLREYGYSNFFATPETQEYAEELRAQAAKLQKKSRLSKGEGMMLAVWTQQVRNYDALQKAMGELGVSMNPLTHEESNVVLDMAETVELDAASHPEKVSSIFKAGLATGLGKVVQEFSEDPALRRRGDVTKSRAGRTAESLSVPVSAAYETFKKTHRYKVVLQDGRIYGPVTSQKAKSLQRTFISRGYKATIVKLNPPAKAYANKWGLSWAFENKKLNRTRTISFDLPPYKTEKGEVVCPGAKLCLAFCYAQFGEMGYHYRWGPKQKNMERNYALSKRADFVSLVIQSLNDILNRGCISKYVKGQWKPLAVRVNGTGDYYSQAYLDKWAQVARAFEKSGLRFYSYTKSLHLDFSRLPSNFLIVKSFGSKFDASIKTGRDRHALIFMSEKHMAEVNAARKKNGLPLYEDGTKVDLPSLPKDEVPVHIGLFVDKSNRGKLRKCYDTSGLKQFWKERTMKNPALPPAVIDRILMIRRKYEAGSPVTKEETAFYRKTMGKFGSVHWQMVMQAIIDYKLSRGIPYDSMDAPFLQTQASIYGTDPRLDNPRRIPKKVEEEVTRLEAAGESEAAAEAYGAAAEDDLLFLAEMEPGERREYLKSRKSRRPNPPLRVGQIAAILLETLVEVPEGAPEGHCYAPFMASGLEPFRQAVDILITKGYVERLPGPWLKATQKGIDLVEQLKSQGNPHFRGHGRIPRPDGLDWCQGCGKTTTDLHPRQDPNCPTLVGAVRWLCSSCLEWPGWSKEIAGYERENPKAETPVLEGSNTDDESWVWLVEDLTTIMERMNPSGEWKAQVKNFGWQKVSGQAEFTAHTGAELLNKILPNTECHFRIYERRGYLAVNNAHHDSPTWDEWYYVFPATYKNPKYGFKPKDWHLEQARRMIMGLEPVHVLHPERLKLDECYICGHAKKHHRGGDCHWSEKTERGEAICGIGPHKFTRPPQLRNACGSPKRKNPPGAKLIGRKVLRIITTCGVLKGNFGALYGLKDGSVFVKCFISGPVKGRVRVVEYLDEAKARREGMKDPTLPWRHDFSSLDVKVVRTNPPGLLLKANKPLWGMR